MAKNNYEVRGNLRLVSLDGTVADGTSTYADRQDDDAISPEDQALANLKLEAVGDVLRAMAEDQPLQAEVFRRFLGLGGRRPESLNRIARSMDLTPSVVQRLNRAGMAAFETHLRFHPRIAYLRAA